jgi:hypothetical protein
MFKLTCFDLSLLVCGRCLKPVRGTADDDLRQKLLAASDFCRCYGQRIARKWRRQP